eukprot:g7588.t1
MRAGFLSGKQGLGGPPLGKGSDEEQTVWSTELVQSFTGVLRQMLYEPQIQVELQKRLRYGTGAAVPAFKSCGHQLTPANDDGRGGCAECATSGTSHAAGSTGTGGVVFAKADDDDEDANGLSCPPAADEDAGTAGTSASSSGPGASMGIKFGLQSPFSPSARGTRTKKEVKPKPNVPPAQTLARDIKDGAAEMLRAHTTDLSLQELIPTVIEQTSKMFASVKQKGLSEPICPPMDDETAKMVRKDILREVFLRELLLKINAENSERLENRAHAGGLLATPMGYDGRWNFSLDSLDSHVDDWLQRAREKPQWLLKAEDESLPLTATTSTCSREAGDEPQGEAAEDASEQATARSTASASTVCSTTTPPAVSLVSSSSHGKIVDHTPVEEARVMRKKADAVWNELEWLEIDVRSEAAGGLLFQPVLRQEQMGVRSDRIAFTTLDELDGEKQPELRELFRKMISLPFELNKKCNLMLQGCTSW